ncbi:hypothetical protein O6H91_11G077100 [Diphasiastrum complanatum]|uniref:Uncharacterized protein n=1 Tax=Diphasiastrum complanatum TaxID=34168 RepID=A0ACC2CAT6_DIPCM|nr:hypothetical protein O6H91_11G077100 [Diphasiastrum complanatum]
MGKESNLKMELQGGSDDFKKAVSRRTKKPLSLSTASQPQPKEGVNVGAEKGNTKGTVAGSSSDAYEVVYVKDNVSVHPTQYASERISGRLRLIKQGSSLFMTWIPYNRARFTEENTEFATPSNGSMRTMAGKSLAGKPFDKDRNLYTIRAVSLSEMRSIRRHTPPLGWQYVIIVLTNGLAFPPLYFHNGGVREFLATLKEHALLVRSADDANVYLINDTQDPLQKSLTSLELTEVVPVSASATQKRKEESRPLIPDSEESGSGEAHPNQIGQTESPPRKPRDATHDFSINVLEKFSMVTKFARDTTAHLMGSLENLGAEQSHRTRYQKENFDLSMDTLPSNVEESLQGAPSTSIACDDSLQKHGGEGKFSDGLASTNVGTFELVDGAQVYSSSTSSLSFGVIDNSMPLPNDSPALVWGRARPPPLGSEEWATFLDADGRVVDFKALKKRIFYGGIEPSLRREVWKFLLEHYQFDSTYKERKGLTTQKKEAYITLKAQWQTISDDQAKRFAKFRERKSRVEKDVVRTDRSLPFYADDENPNITLLRDILITYSFYNFDLGYCQGMSDLLSPILYVMKDEAESFWCFAALMERLAPNFHRDQNGMHSQLQALLKLVQLLDTPLHDYFKQADCLNYFFCFRWILIQFKREFDYDNVMRLWEVLWTHHLSEHFHMYMCVAILKRYRRKIMDEQMEFDTLLKFINELSGHIDLESTLRDAEALCLFAGERGAACIPAGTPPAIATFENKGIELYQDSESTSY